ncbi:MAG: 50S ribosome-binding GTPase [Clostridiales bacterium]|nr:50S ribosome-binding GTPase [Clostridiales bacterium]
MTEATNIFEPDVETDQNAEPRKSIFELLEEDIMSSDLPEHEKNNRLSRLIKMMEKKVNIILVGATGSGKSSTINALFNMEVAKVGVGVDPETDYITSYMLDNLTIWDTPGLGDGVHSDEKYNNMIIRKLSEVDENGDPLIDLVLVVLDASSKDLGTSYDLINNVIIPCLGDDKEGRILIGINQADVAMKGKHWDAENNVPDEVLLKFLKQKAKSVETRIKEATGVFVRPIFYCAGYKEDGEEQCKPYNLTKLLYYIIRSIPKDKRLAIADNINVDEDKWLHDDEEEDYKEKTRLGFWESIGCCMEEGAETGGVIGGVILGIPGLAVGFVVGGFCGAVKGFFENIFG